MTTNRLDLLTPIGGRLVGGSLYNPRTTDAEGKALTTRSGPNAGQARVDYFIAVAIPKKNETHWSQTEWGAPIWAYAQSAFRNGQASSPNFAWKIEDGDSQIPNSKGRKPCDRDGYPRHWVLRFNGGRAPSLFNNDGTKKLLEPNAINLGDYVQVFGNVSDNGSTQQPGIYLNHYYVALNGYGERIVLGIEADAVGFGGALPPGASATPIAAGFNPATVAAPALVTPPPAIVPSQPIAPYPAILAPAPIMPPPVAPPVVPVRIMTPAAQGNTYEQLISQGWTDELLVTYGLMIV